MPLPDVGNGCELFGNHPPCVFADFFGYYGSALISHPLPALLRGRLLLEKNKPNAERRAILFQNSHVIKVQAGSSNDPFISLHSALQCL